MSDIAITLMDSLVQRGWRVAHRKDPVAMPESVLKRYRWIPDQVRELAQRFDEVVNAEDNAWFLTAFDYAGTGNSAYRWNEWELQSLEGASDDPVWSKSIQEFWDEHFPIVMSVKCGYAYFAIQHGTNAVVLGEEPEYEETKVVSRCFSDFLKMVAAGDLAVSKCL